MKGYLKLAFFFSSGRLHSASDINSYLTLVAAGA